ncbi:hypothetical protein LJR143_003920 [Pseudoxanthomonas sp. LjRoot143]|uniref:hypothetical protein n=1 Tax=Pseudoxanthomonas sp. LjRoot143 TaxID=3342266 RepID=UPI003ECEFC4A
MKLDYEKLILLDAENLAETGIGAAYDELLPELKHYISNPEQIEQFIDNDLPRYAIRSNGAEYVIYAPDMPENESWGAATYVFFKIVNDQLADTQVRLYAINGGNDLGGLFLTHEQARAAQVSLPNPSDWPYLPEANGPWYGQHH